MSQSANVPVHQLTDRCRRLVFQQKGDWHRACQWWLLGVTGHYPVDRKVRTINQVGHELQVSMLTFAIF